MVTRRTLLRGAGVTMAIGAPVFVSACGDDEEKQPTPAGPPDAEILNPLLDIEYAAVAAYRAAIPVLGAATRRSAAAILAQEQAHAAALVKAIRALGATPIQRKPASQAPRFANGTEAFSVLREALRENPIPHAFETGKPA